MKKFKNIFHKRRITHDFIFNGLDEPTDGKPNFDISIDCKYSDVNKSDEKVFLVGENISDINLDKKGLAILEKEQKFACMAVKIDSLFFDYSSYDKKQQAKIKKNGAAIIKPACLKKKCYPFTLSGNLLGYLIPGGDERICRELAALFQEKFAVLAPETISVGIAVYPASNFTKSETIINAVKALDHAAFLGRGSVVVFDAVSLNISGDKFYQQGDLKGAIRELKAALALDPENINVINSLGVCFGVLNDFKKACHEFRKVVEKAPDEVMAIYNLGLAHMFQGNKLKALDYMLRACRKDPNVFEVLYQIGRLFLDMKNYKKAVRFFKKALVLQPESWPVLRYLGKSYLALHKTKEAINIFEKAIKQNPNDAESLSELGFLMDLQGENSEITTLFCRHSVCIEPDNGLFRYKLGCLYLKHNQLEQALKELTKAAQLGYEARADIKEARSRIRASAV